MHGDNTAYGSWGIAVTMIVVSLFFIFKFIPMRTRLGKRSGGALIAFIVALFAEMYGFPLSIYLLGHFAGVRIPLDHISGHLLGDLITSVGFGNGWVIVMIASNLLIILGIWLVSAGWERVYESQGELVIDGIYRHMRHPQYTGIFVVTLGFLIQWPTLATLILWPLVIWMYIQLARREERDVLKQHPTEYLAYMNRTPMFLPRLLRSRRPSDQRGSHHAA